MVVAIIMIIIMVIIIVIEYDIDDDCLYYILYSGYGLVIGNTRLMICLPDNISHLFVIKHFQFVHKAMNNLHFQLLPFLFNISISIVICVGHVDVDDPQQEGIHVGFMHSLNTCRCRCRCRCNN